jgi:transcriptional regulator with XRE-family HTH domain
MKLSEFMSARELSEAQLGRLLGVGQATVNRYARGERIPRPDVMRRIVEVTEGQVGPADFYDLSAPASPAAQSVEAA